MQRIHADQRQAAAKTLAAAFHDDPILQILQPDPARRSAFGTWFMGVAVTYALRRHGEVWGNEDASAVGVWLPPGRTDVGIGGLLRAGMIALPLKVGLRGVARAMGVMSATDRFHKQVKGPHWYLMVLGTRLTPGRERTREGMGAAAGTALPSDRTGPGTTGAH